MNQLRLADEHRTGRHPATGAKARPRHRTGTRIVAGVLVALMAWGAAGTSLARADATLDPGGRPHDRCRPANGDPARVGAARR